MKPLVYTNLFFATAAVFCKAFKWYLHCQDCQDSFV